MSQWPGIQVISSKARLARNLKQMRSLFPSEFNFFPETLNLPEELEEFQIAMQRESTFIVKPSHNCQGRGIYLMNKFNQYQALDGNDEWAAS